jgi:hypothetical protein
MLDAVRGGHLHESLLLLHKCLADLHEVTLDSKKVISIQSSG